MHRIIIKRKLYNFKAINVFCNVNNSVYLFQMKIKVVILYIICLILIVSATDGGSLGSDLDKNLKKIAILPFEHKTFVFPTEEKSKLATQQIAIPKLIYESIFNRLSSFEFYDFNESLQDFNSIVEDFPDLSYRELVFKLGSRLGVDAVLIGNISVYRERKGSDFGVESPASVAFSSELINTNNRVLLWETYYTETQKPLFNNLFEVPKFFKRKGKWIKVDQLANEGALIVSDRLYNYLMEYK